MGGRNRQPRSAKKSSGTKPKAKDGQRGPGARRRTAETDETPSATRPGKPQKGAKRGKGSRKGKTGMKDGDRSALLLALQNQAKLKAGLPRLALDRNAINRLKFILDKYEHAKRLYSMGDSDSELDESDDLDPDKLDIDNLDDAQIEKLLGLEGLGGHQNVDSSGDSSSDDGDDDDLDSSDLSDEEDESNADDDDMSIDSEVARDFVKHIDDSDQDQDDYEYEEHEGDPFVDEDDVPEPPPTEKVDTFVSSTNASVAFEDLSWLQSIGFPSSRSVDALKRCTPGDPLEALAWLYNSALDHGHTTRSSGTETLHLFNITEDVMLATRQEEAMVLEAMFGADFDAKSQQNTWLIHLTASIPTDFLAKYGNPAYSATSQPHTLEIHFPGAHDCAYPYEPPLLVFRDKTDRLASRFAIAIGCALQKLARGWVGQPMIFSLVSWLQGAGELEALLRDPPAAYVRLAQAEQVTVASLPASGRVKGAAGQGSVQAARTRGPLPRFQELSDGVGVAVTLKKDQGTGRTVNGYVQEVLTRGDHPRGVKVRLEDGQVGRVQFLTGLTHTSASRAIHAPAFSSKSTNLASGFKTLSIKDASGSPLPMKMATLSKTKAGNTGFITGIGATRSPSPVRAAPVAIKTFMPNLVPAVLDAQSRVILDSFRVQQTRDAYVKMRAQREKLPAYVLKEEILRVVKENRVVIVSGETGCGKSTQVPQFILDEAILSSKGARCKVLVTQPRRISALGLADRVSSERGESVGDSVGYHIRLENRMSAGTRILFCTTGILLRRLEEGSPDGGIEDVSHIIVDEVHERSLDSDFLLMVLKDLLLVRTDLKLILMSATLNAELFAAYFNGAPTVHIPGRTFPVRALFLEDVLAKTAYTPPTDLARKGGARKGKFPPQKLQGDGMNADKKGKKPELDKRSEGKDPSRVTPAWSDAPAIKLEEVPDDELDPAGLMKRYPNLSNIAAQSLAMMDTDKIQYPLIEILVVEIVARLLGKSVPRVVPDAQNGKGRGKGRRPQVGGTGHMESLVGGMQMPNRGILIFLPGFAEIATLHELLLQNLAVKQGTNNGRLCLALHSTLSSEEQMRVFNRPPDGSVKIVIATNVAETSITIDDVVFVIDCGKMKQTQFDPMKGMASLEECWVSKANATQRRGRAGRVQEGTCIHLFTSHKFHIMIEQQPPEIHRTPLEQICLRIKILPFLKGPIEQVLSKVVEPPTRDAVQAAISSLRMLRALTKEEDLTPLGFHLGRLPVDVRIGKLILFGSIFGCLDSVLTIASALSVKSPFVAPFEKRFLADAKKQEFATGASDHLTLLTAYNTWLVARRDGFPAERAFLYDNFLSGRTLAMISSVKRQLAELLSDIGFVKTQVRAKDMERRGGRQSDGVADALGENMTLTRRGEDLELVKAVMVSALYPNVIKIETPQKGGKVPSAQDLKFWVRGNEAVFIHPTSVNYKVGKYPTGFLVYHEKIKTSKVYIRDCSSVSAFALAFFGGKLTWDQRQKLINLDDGWIRFAAQHKEAAVIEATRTAFDELLQMKIENPELDVSATDLVREIVSLVTRNIS
ncbi:hypothetical protein BC830DRAFT_1114343 [Chytriomyces sp. MP71]|nr:hypothetical protein BC830DRAFT_1114343 [Chytriomyces sp. MP71]